MRIQAAHLLLLLCAACATPYPSWKASREGVYDELPDPAWASFEAARRDIQLGRLRLAREGLSRLWRDHPRNLPVGIWLQETEIALALEAAALEAGDSPSDPAAVLESVRKRYREVADAEESVPNLVLAARVETDQFAALALLERALRLDEQSVWAHYGKAHVLAQQEEWKGARRSLERALDLDPGHLWSRRLEAWMLARTGRIDDATNALEVWLDRAAGDSRIDSEWLRQAALDLALLFTLGGSPQKTRDLLAEYGASLEAPGRQASLEAAALEALGDPRGALAAAVRAHEADPEDGLPLVQQALLYERWLDDPERAQVLWQKVLDLAEQQKDLSAMVQRARATVHLERLSRTQP